MNEHSPSGINVLLVADPGQPTRRAQKIEDRLNRELEESFAPPIGLHIQTEPIRIRTDNTIDFDVARRLAEEYERVDVVILLTEMPRHSEGKPLVAELFPDEKLAIVSCPTLGVTFPKKRLQQLVMNCIEQTLPEERRGRIDLRDHHWSRWDQDESTGRYALRAHTVTGAPRTVAGMVLSNDPWRTAPKLSSALAAAGATGAFGIFYSSIWQMSDALSLPRLLSIGLGAILVMTLWLITSNRLWDRPVKEHLASVVMLYNLSTVVTLFICILALYLALGLLILVGGLVVIDPDFMSYQLGKESRFSNYLDIAWMSAAMGVVAGALGSSFDSKTDLRQLTHGQRERQRRLTEDQEKKEDGAKEKDDTREDAERDADDGSETGDESSKRGPDDGSDAETRGGSERDPGEDAGRRTDEKGAAEPEDRADEETDREAGPSGPERYDSARSGEPRDGDPEWDRDQGAEAEADVDPDDQSAERPEDSPRANSARGGDSR
ncbi:hypothetical protein [Rothia santali]|uniref:hypothetical protein n=1 Tax=Rothia santali TaxID=2949643 RepID=UPI002814C37A|nr:hypothetical protein [Rothia santali]